MNSKHVILIALAVIAMMACVPLASAEWMNGVWYPSDVYANMISGDTVVHNPVTGVDSKYNPDVGSVYDKTQNPNTYSGRVIFIIRSGMATLNPTLTIVNDAMPNVTKNYDIPDNAVLEIDGLPAGNFTATLDNYNVPDETAHFVIAVSQQEPSRVPFVGQAASQAPVHVPVITIERAQYGAPFSFHVTSATYGANGHFYDVTGIVNGMISGNTLSVPAENSLFGDPIVGTIKTLTVTYVANGVSNTISVPEHQTLSVVITSTGSADVLAYFRHFLTGNTVSTTQPGASNDWKWLNSFQSFYAPAPFPDPAPGIEKGIVVTYNVDGGATKTINIPNVDLASTTITFT
jgi:hypothetical protein